MPAKPSKSTETARIWTKELAIEQLSSYISTNQAGPNKSDDYTQGKIDAYTEALNVVKCIGLDPTAL